MLTDEYQQLNFLARCAKRALHDAKDGRRRIASKYGEYARFDRIDSRIAFIETVIANLDAAIANLQKEAAQ